MCGDNHSGLKNNVETFYQLKCIKCGEITNSDKHVNECPRCGKKGTCDSTTNISLDRYFVSVEETERQRDIESIARDIFVGLCSDQDALYDVVHKSKDGVFIGQCYDAACLFVEYTNLRRNGERP